MQVIMTTTIAGKIKALFIRLFFEEEIHHVGGHFGPIKFYPDDKGCWLHVYTCTCKQVDYSHVYVHADRQHFGDFHEGITWQSKIIQQNLLQHFAQNQLFTLMISIFHIVKKKKKQPKLAKISIIDLHGISSKFFHFHSVLKTLNNLIQKTHHLNWAEQNSTNDFVS